MMHHQDWESRISYKEWRVGTTSALHTSHLIALLSLMIRHRLYFNNINDSLRLINSESLSSNLALLNMLQMKIEPNFVLFFDCSKEEMTRRLLNRNQVGWLHHLSMDYQFKYVD